MSVIKCISKTSSSFLIRMDELENTANQYEQFKIEYKKKTASAVTVITWTDSSTINHYSQKLISGLSSATEYEIWIYAMYQGEWYVAGTYFSSIYTFAPTVSNVEIYEGYHKIILAWEHLSGAIYEVKKVDNNTGETSYHSVTAHSSEYGYYDFEPTTGHSYSIYVAAIINGQYSAQYWGYSNYLTKKTLSKPSISVNNNIVSKTSSYSVVLEYEQVSDYSPYPYDRYSRDIFYLAATHQNDDKTLRYPSHLKRFVKPSVTFKTLFNASAQGEFVNLANGYVDNVISRLNQIVDPVSFSRTTGTSDITITFGTRSELFNDSGSEYTNGYWSHVESNGVIYSGSIKIAIDPVNETIEHALFEEMTQVLGLGNDHFLDPDSLFYQIPYPNPSDIVGCDEDALRLLYNHNLPTGASNEETAQIINSICYALMESSTKTLSYLQLGSQYRIRAYAVSGSSYSEKTDWIYFTPIMPRPTNWTWYLGASGDPFNMTNTQWNSFCETINGFRRYKGLSDYPFTLVQKGWVFDHSYINQAIRAINDMSPPAGVAPELKDSNGNGKIKTKDIVYRWYFDNLSSALNSIY